MAVKIKRCGDLWRMSGKDPLTAEYAELTEGTREGYEVWL
jgi:hypothetical protein